MTDPGLVRTVLGPARLRRLGWSILIGVSVAFVVFLVAADGVQSGFGGRVGGDFAAFYAAGDIVRQSPSDLFDLELQRRLQEPYLDQGFLPFPYPPPVAFLYVPFSMLPFVAGYVVLVLVLVAVLIVTVRGLVGVITPHRRHLDLAVLGTLTFPPVLRSIAGTQTATLALGVLVAGWLLLERERSLAAGVVLGLLWFKPQFAAPLLGLFLVSGHIRVVGGMIASGAGMYLAGVLPFGAEWPVTWFREIIAFTDEGNQAFNTAQTVSPVEYVRGVAPSDVQEIIAAVAIVVIAGWAVVMWRVARTWPSRLALAGVTLVLVSPHALVYEMALLVPAIAWLMVSSHREPVVEGLTWWLAGALAVLPLPALVRVLIVVALAYRVSVAIRRTSASPPFAAWDAHEQPSVPS